MHTALGLFADAADASAVSAVVSAAASAVAAGASHSGPSNNAKIGVKPSTGNS